jgi:hypothetical protein
MKYVDLSHLGDEAFRRLTGVQRKTFATMQGILEASHAQKKTKGGRPNALCVPEMLLMTLEYLREYRTYFHIGTAYGVGESTAYKNIRWVEDTLVKDGTFALPGRKELLKSDTDIEVVLVDATESPVQRPKKNSGGTIPAKRNATR